MIHRFFVLGLLLFILVPNVGAAADEAQEFRLRDGDRVAFVGDALIEQAQYHPWVEVMLTTAFPESDVVFRNLGWNADTPAGASRVGLSLLQAGHEPADEGWKQLHKQLRQVEPNVVILGYGMASSLEAGREGLDQFVNDYQRLIDSLREISPEVRLVLLSPLQRVEFPNQSPPAGLKREYNAERRATEEPAYDAESHASDENAESHREVLIDYANAIRELAEQNDSVFVDLLDVATSADQRRDAIHLNEDGYRALAKSLSESLGIDQNALLSSPHVQRLRQAIERKNEWWFHRSRPANMAYVFGFRKHEQGQNAVEIPKFDRLIAAEEARIAKLRRLDPVDIPPPTERTQSTYAEFTPQATPQFTVGDGLEVALWAENPMLNKPIQMNFDPAGRLWVASSQAYPMIEVGQSAPDKIVVLEDTDSDGKADESTVFAEGLLIPTGLAPDENGVYVAQSTDLLYLQDTDGDGKADSKTRVLSGFGTEDTHHNLHTLRWGPDGRLYLNQSVYTRTNTETPRGVVRLKAGGGFRLNPDSLRLQTFFRGLWNPWGHQFDSFGRSFLTDGAGFEGIAYAFPGAVFNPTPGARRQLDLISPGRYPKFCSAEIIQGDTFPEDWQGSIVTCDFRANRVTRFSLQEKDSGFVTVQEDDLLRTSASTFRPIDVKQGPDGALYIADWSNPVINHGEVDFRDPRRDRWHGRIWRVTAKESSKQDSGATIADLTKQPVDQLLNLLKSDDRYRRDQARRVLIRRPDATLGELDRWVSQQDDEFAQLQGLWLYQAFSRPNLALLASLLSAGSEDVRAAAVRVLGDWADPQTDAAQPISMATSLEYFRQLVRDPDPRVRLEAVCGLAKQQSVPAARVALSVLGQPMDRFLDFALAEFISNVADPLMRSIEQEEFFAPESTAAAPTVDRQLEFVLASIPPAQASRYLSEHLASSPIPKDGSGPWITLIGQAGGQEELRMLFEQTIQGGLNDDAAVHALEALNDAQRLRNLRPSGSLDGIATLFESASPQIRAAALALAGVWKLGDHVPAIASVAGQQQASRDVRLAAIESLRAIGNQAAKAQLEQLLDEAVNETAADGSAEEIAETTTAMLAALARLDAGAAIQPFLDLQANVSDEQAALPLWRAVLSRQDAAQQLVAHLASSDISQTSARAGLRVAREKGPEASELVAALTPLTGLAMTAEEMTPERIQQMVRQVAAQGDPYRGEKIYRRQNLACTSCHAIGGVGGKVGPDMTSLGASAPMDYLIESLFDPNAKIKENYHSVIVMTDDDRLLSGIEVQRSEDELVLRDAKDELIRIPQASIVATKAGQSLMPSGVIDRLAPQEQLDLVSFLSQLGKPGDFDASRSGVARLYDVFAGTHRIEQEGADRITSGQLQQGWKPLTARVNGDVSAEVLRELTKQPINIALVHVYLRTEVEVTQAGNVSLEVEGSESADMWIDGQRVDGKSAEGATTFQTELPAGRHTVIVRLDARALPPTTRLTSDDVTFMTRR